MSSPKRRSQTRSRRPSTRSKGRWCSRSRSRSFNRLLALYRAVRIPPAVRPAASEDRAEVEKLIRQHGRFAAVRELLLARGQGATVVKRPCMACGTVTDHRGEVCCSRGTHLLLRCDSCGKNTTRVRGTRRCLEPGHQDPVRQWCYTCGEYRHFNPKTSDCITCGARFGDFPTKYS